jgi:uncharacterized protein HemX
MANEETSPPSDNDSNSKSERSEFLQKEPVPVRRSSFAGGLAFIIAMIALLASGYLSYTLLYERYELIQTDVPAALRELDEKTRLLDERLSVLQADNVKLKEAQDSVKLSIDKLQGDLGRNRTDWIVAEVERLLQIANNRLQLARDPSSALSALRTADRQLALLANPGFLPIRRELASEITQLEAIEKTDVAGITLRLGSLAQNVDRLPILRDVHALGALEAEPNLAGDSGAVQAAADGAGRLWRDLLSLVRVRNSVDAQKPLLPPEQQYFLRENLRLMLYGAQQALLQANVATYRQNLQATTQWLETHFDTNSQAVATTITEIENLKNTKIATELPDVSGSLNSLRTIVGRSANP